MSLFTKSVSFLAVLAVIPSAYALTARPSVIGNASRRIPTMTAVVSGNGYTTTSGTTTTTSSLLENAECIDAYTACMKGGDACGSDFEECTNKVLFHGKMPQCLSTLAQCSTAGVTSLFGTGTITALSAIATKNSYGEVTDYTYPTDGSVLGQMITGAAISNKYDTSTCVKRYTSCLKKDSVCGNDFELCTTDKEFRKQRVFCDSTLARCQSEGLIELFGSANTSGTPSATSRIGELIAEGAALAAVNAVSTCYKVVDQCILNACATNPYKCYENSTTTTVSLVEAINNGTVAGDGTAVTAKNAAATAIANIAVGMDIISRSNISSYIKNSCLDTIGSNKYCYATFLGNGQMPTSSQLKDEDNQEEIFDEAYSARMNSAMKAKISDLVDQFDTKAKQKCTETIKACVMRTCGSGSGAACYYQTFGAGAVEKSINGSQNYETLKTGCSAVVNTDAYCKYAAANPNTTGTYSYTYVNNDAFTILFPMYEGSGTADPIGAVGTLNASLQNSYNDAALATMRKRCQNVATSCVRSMCGADYQNCYRNRTDVYSSLTNTGESSYDKSMNKVGGVLDYTVVLGLCLDTVKNASVCEEHLKIQQTRVAKDTENSLWGNTVRGDWIDGGSATTVTRETVQAQDEYGNALCTSTGGYGQQACDTVDADGNVYDQPVTTTYTSYIQSQAASSLFKDLIYDLEKEAQAKYSAKLTKQQNMCMSSNTGGVLGNRELGSTFLWVKLKSNTVPKSYAVSGLKPNQFTASNDIFGSFCRVRVTLNSDDKKIQDVIAKGTDWAVTYFAAGDSFICGSWIPEKALNDLANAVAKDARDKEAKGNDRIRGWMTLLGTLGGGAGGAALGNSIANGKALGGLTGLGKNNTSKQAAEQCVTLSNSYVNARDDETRRSIATRMITQAQKINKDKEPNAGDRIALETAIDNVRNSMFDYTASQNSSTNLGNCIVQKVAFKDAQSVFNNSAYKANCLVREVSTSGIIASNLDCNNAVTAANNAVTAAKAAVTAANKASVQASSQNSEDKQKVVDAIICDGGELACNLVKEAASVALASSVSVQTVKDAANTKATEISNSTITLLLCDSNVAHAQLSSIDITGKTGAFTTDDKGNSYSNVQSLNRQVNALSTECQKWTDAGASSGTKAGIIAATTAVTAIAGGILTYQATKDIQDAKLDKVEQAAYDEWMNEVGNHIRCFVGGDEVGTYGETITTSME